MKARPILFSAPMVRAILAGQKTQTRRVVKGASLEWINWFSDEDNNDRPAMLDGGAGCHSGAGIYVYSDNYPDEGSVLLKSPYGQPGDRLWVRETWGMHTDMRGHGVIVYRSGGGARQLLAEDNGDGDPCGIGVETVASGEPAKWRPSIHMPRWASRLTLEVISVRVERLQDITEADAIAEGVERLTDDDGWRCYLGECGGYTNAVTSFRSLWESINGHGSWAENPWVWRVELKRVTE